MFASSALTAEEIRGVTTRVAEALPPASDAHRIDLLRAAEQLKCALEALQARVAVAFDASQRAQAAAVGEPQDRQGRGVDSQIALARRESPHRGRQLLGFAKVLHEMPHTAAAFRAGRISEYRAMILVRETAFLQLEHRQAVDERLAADADQLEATGTRGLEREVRRLSAELDAKAVAERRRRAEAERCVTVRPAPDTMAYLTGLMPMSRAIGAWAALKTAADRLKSAGDPRGKAQIMADLAYERLTRPTPDEDHGGGFVPVTLRLVMTDRALFTGAADPAFLGGHPVPADLGRELLADALAAQAGRKTQVWLKRLFTSPRTGQLVAMDARGRRFDGGLAELLELRDRWCRNRWCDAAIRHKDHVTGWLRSKQTTLDDSQGLCEQCNYAKQAVGWTAHAIRGPDGGHVVETTTPTGHNYTSHAPPLVEPAPDPDPRSGWVEVEPCVWIRAA